MHLKGAGANKRKADLMVAWLSGGFGPAYAQLTAKIMLTKAKTTESEWIALHSAKKVYGKAELKARLTKGTLQWRRDPDDDRFYQVRQRKEKESTGETKVKEISLAATEALWQALDSEEQLGWSAWSAPAAGKSSRVPDKSAGPLALLDEEPVESDSKAGPESAEEEALSESDAELPDTPQSSALKRPSAGQLALTDAALDDVSTSTQSCKRADLVKRAQKVQDLNVAARRGGASLSKSKLPAKVKAEVAAACTALKKSACLLESVLANNKPLVEDLKKALTDAVGALTTWRSTRLVPARLQVKPTKINPGRTPGASQFFSLQSRIHRVAKIIDILTRPDCAKIKKKIARYLSHAVCSLA